MNHETAVSNAKDFADRILAPAARQNDKEARFSAEAIAALGPAGCSASCCPPRSAALASDRGRSPRSSQPLRKPMHQSRWFI